MLPGLRAFAGFHHYATRLTRCKLNTVLDGVALVVNLHTLGQKTLATLSATAGEDGATVLGSHAGAETELALAAALGRLVCSLAHNLVSMFALKVSLFRFRGRGEI